MQETPKAYEVRGTRGYRVRRTLSWAGPRLLRIDQMSRVRDTELGTDVTGPYWVFALVKIQRGAIRYVHGETALAAPARSFAVFLPPWSVVQASLERCSASTTAFASDTVLPGETPQSPVAWPLLEDQQPGSVSEIAKALSLAWQPVEISRVVAPSPTVQAIKTLLDHSYIGGGTVTAIARRIRISPSSMSRCFKRSYGMPPIAYRHRLRVMDAMFRVAAGGDILEVLGDVGFEDASRLYHHFRTLLCAPPGWHAPRRSNNAKT